MADPSSLDRAPEPPVGYRLIRTLGHGSDGWVALAVQESVGRQVAVKTLYAVDPLAAARLRREGQALSRLASERIVRVFDLVEEAGRISLVMELVDGPNLGDRMAQAPALTAAERVTVLRDVAEALDAAHQAGVVHRDVKPGNVLLDRLGRAKLTDFGIARLTDTAGAFRTSDGTVSGTRRYAAPEQRRDPEAESPTMDAYGFGVLAYELLVGRLPDDEQAIAPAAWLPPAVRRAFEAATSVDPDARPTAAELIRELAAVPESTWPDLQPAHTLEEDGTAREDGARREHGSTIAARHEPLAVPAAVPWTEQSVYRPQTRRQRPSALVIGLAVGLVIAAVIGAFSG